MATRARADNAQTDELGTMALTCCTAGNDQSRWGLLGWMAPAMGVRIADGALQRVFGDGLGNNAQGAREIVPQALSACGHEQDRNAHCTEEASDFWASLTVYESHVHKGEVRVLVVSQRSG